MKIAILIEQYDPEGGGAERNVRELAREFTARGHDVSILAGGASKAVARDNPGVESLYHGKLRTAWRLRRFSDWAERRVREGGFDASLSVTTAAAATVVQPLGGTFRETFARNAAMRQSPFLRQTKRLATCLSPKRQMAMMLERRTIHGGGVHRFAALSRYVENQLRHAGVSAERIALVPNAVELNRPPADQRLAERRRFRTEYRLSDDDVAYLFAAFNPKLKGFVPLMRALRVVRDRGVPAVVIVAGKCGYAENRLAMELGVREHTRFVGLTQRMPAMFSAMDVTVHPTFYDPSSRVVIESLIMGTPAITTRFNGAADLLTRDDGRMCGEVVDDPHDINALADAMTSLADAPKRAACAAATDGLAPTLSIRRHVDLLERLLEKHGD